MARSSTVKGKSQARSTTKSAAKPAKPALLVVPEGTALPDHTLYLARTLPYGRRTRVMDVGANPVNRPAYADLAEAGLVEVHGFEPGEQAFQRLMAAKGAHETYHPHAVGAGGPATFHDCENGSFSSLFAPDPVQIAALGHWQPSLRVKAEIPLTTVALDKVPDLPRPDMLKMDTQGAELAILSGGQDILSQAVVIMPELRFYQLYRDEPMLGLVDQKLREMGFMLHKILPGARVRLTSSQIDRLRPAMTRNQMVDADAIYIRDLARPDVMSVAQISRLALLADSVFTSMDVVLRCLDLLVARRAIAASAIDTYISKLPRNFLVQPATTSGT